MELLIIVVISDHVGCTLVYAHPEEPNFDPFKTNLHTQDCNRTHTQIKHSYTLPSLGSVKNRDARTYFDRLPWLSLLNKYKRSTDWLYYWQRSDHVPAFGLKTRPAPLNVTIIYPLHHCSWLVYSRVQH